MTLTSIPPRRQNGFSLPEIMVGMIIGMMGIIIIMQVTSVFESRKRTTTSGDDAQNGGAIALYSVQRNVTQAGYGISSANLVGVPMVTPYITLANLAPVLINPAQLAGVGDAETDSFIVIYGNSNTTTEGAIITNSTPTPYTITGGAGQSDGSNAAVGGHSFLNGDWVTVDDGSGNGSTGSTTHYLYVASGVSTGTVSVSIPTLRSQAYVAPFPGLQDSAAGPHPVLFNLGPSPTIQAYAVRNGVLGMCDYLTQNCASPAATWVDVTGGIVNMQVQCEGAASLRVALVVRNNQKAPNQIVSTTTPTWNPGGVSSPVAASPATSWGSDWNQYRYKTFETVIPIRNAIWSGVAGC